MKFKRKAGLVFSSALLAVSVMAGCSNNKGSEQTSSEKDDVVTIKYYNFDNELQAATTEQYIDQFQKENPNINVESISLVPGNSLETLKKLDVLMASGEKVDLVMLPYADAVFERTAQGVLAPLDEFYDKNNLKPEEEYYVNPQYEGKYYGIQNNVVQNYVLLNKDALDEAGLPVPKLGWTWDDFADYTRKLTKGEGNEKQYGAYFHNWSLYANPMAQIQFKHPFLTEEGKTNFDDPTFEYFFNLRRTMEKEDQSIKPYSDVIGAKLNYRTEFFNGDAAMLLTGTYTINDPGDLTNYPHDFKTAFAPVPLYSKDDKAEIFMGGNFLSIGANSDYKEESFKFARFMSTNLTEARTELPGWKKGDVKPLVERFISGKEEMYDVDSLMYTLFESEVESLPPSKVSVAYGALLDKIITDGFSQFILEDKSTEEVQDWMVEEANKVIENSK